MSQQPLSLPADSLDIATPFEGDQLGREALAVQLSGYIDRLKAGAVLGIDAPWGEGKTWFGRHWAKKLQADHKVAFIDAFENDYVDDPFVLIASDLSMLLDDGQGQGVTLRRKAAGVMKAIVPMGTKALINVAGRLLVGTSDLSADLEDAVKNATEGAGDGAEKWIEKRIEAMATERASLKSFRLTLSETAQKSDRPVVVFIDELDRCKPSFAVTLIERIKHLFDVPNLVFVLLLNRQQMEVAIEGQYGAGTDGQAYLGKFVNLWFELPRATVGTRSETLYEAYATQVLQRYGFDQNNRLGADQFKKDAVLWAGAFQMSLRDIDRMCALFVLAQRAATGLLGYLIAIKVKYPSRFSDLRRNDAATHTVCSKDLQALVRDKSDPVSPRWPDLLFLGLAELHQFHAGAIQSNEATTFRRFGSEIFGRIGSLDQVFMSTANLLDLPIESF